MCLEYAKKNKIKTTCVAKNSKLKNKQIFNVKKTYRSISYHYAPFNSKRNYNKNDPYRANYKFSILVFKLKESNC